MNKNVLVLNRGEIALRAIHVALALGLRPILYTARNQKPDKCAVSCADLFQADLEGINAFLDLESVRAAILEKDIGLVYPGYGFLSERADLAELCADLGVSFIGPPATAMRALGQKDSAFSFARSAGVPTLQIEQPGPADFPVMAKAVSGGGGRGNLLIMDDTQWHAELEKLKRRARSLFKSDEIITERFLPKARHVELQFGVDNFGNVTFFGTRDCSLQRSYQKIIEEGPIQSEVRDVLVTHLPSLEEGLLACGYRGVGTIEFLWDTERRELYFLEVNPRIQVEHPVTESLCDVDLVEYQFKVALGERVPARTFIGREQKHCVEVRVYAEKPEEGFLPDAGQIHFLYVPTFSYLRWDCSVSEADFVESAFDPLIGKLIVYGDDREQAIQRAMIALQGMIIHGVESNIDYLQSILDLPLVRSNEHDHNLLSREGVPAGEPAATSLSFAELRTFLDAPDPGMSSVPQASGTQTWKELHIRGRYGR